VFCEASALLLIFTCLKGQQPSYSDASAGAEASVIIYARLSGAQMRDETYIFAYGTLRPPHPDTAQEDSRYYPQIAGYLLESRPADLLNATLFDLGSYPAARPGPGIVHGDLLRLDIAALAILDRIEGHPVFYSREKALVQIEGEQIEAWVYWAPEGIENAGVPIGSGDWFDRPLPETTRAGQPGQEPQIPRKQTDADPGLKAQIQRLSEAEAIWLTTVRPDSRPHSTPVWHGWYHGRIYVVTRPSAVKVTNIRSNSAVAVSLPDPMSPLMMEGRATVITTLRDSLRPIFLAKYDWDIASDQDYTAIIEITPYRLRAWGDLGEGRWGGPILMTL
jgi:gamma-glutamylcyclotransferase (GGCT)/AIG2-like uncharacterized protein YtfP/general stress protein 26